jgi:alkylglycerol monooxygenase
MDAQAIGWEFVRRLRLMFYLNPVDDMTFNKGEATPTIIVDGIPMFFVFIIVELLGMKLIRLFMNKKEADNSPGYRWNDFLCSLSLGTVQQASGLILDLCGLHVALISYNFVFENLRLFEIDMYSHKNIYFVILMLGYDCGYYWFHRTVHEYHLLWAMGHSTHHSGEDYNFACALRQGAGQGFTSWPFYLPLALIGFPPAAFAAHSQANTLYQFWV